MYFGGAAPPEYMFYPPQNVPLKLRETVGCPQQSAVFLFKSQKEHIRKFFCQAFFTIKLAAGGTYSSPFRGEFRK